MQEFVCFHFIQGVVLARSPRDAQSRFKAASLSFSNRGAMAETLRFAELELVSAKREDVDGPEADQPFSRNQKGSRASYLRWDYETETYDQNSSGVF